MTAQVNSNVLIGRLGAWVAAALLIAFAVLVGPASTQASAATMRVSSEDEFWVAVSAATSDNSGDHTINIAADFTFACSRAGYGPIYDGTRNLTINGNGHAVTATAASECGFLWFGPAHKTLTLNNITLTGFTGLAAGGAIYAPGGNVVVNNSTFIGNTASGAEQSFGGAIYSDFGSITVTDSVFTGNFALPTKGTANTKIASGGAITSQQGSVTVTGSTFTSNYADAGGGLVSGGAIGAHGSLTVTDSTFDSNYIAGAKADRASFGGAVFVKVAGAVIADSTFVDNYADSGAGKSYGGAVYLVGGGTVTNTTFVSNSSTTATGVAFGGGLATEGATTVRHVTATGNHADDRGANLFAFSALLTVVASVAVSPSGARDCGFEAGGLAASGGHNFLSDSSCFTLKSTDKAGSDPKLGALADNGGPTDTMAPLSTSSPVVNAIPESSCSELLDQRGVSRPRGGRCDIGAVELLVPDHGVVRLAGANRFATAARISAYHHPFGASTIFMSTGANFPDALAGAGVAAGKGAPLMLTGGTSIPAETATELDRLGPSRSYVLGGTGVVSPGVAKSLKPYGPVSRLSGADRYATAVAISKNAYPTGADTVLVAVGSGFPDALAGGPLAKKLDAPVLLTATGELPASVRQEINRLNPDTIIVLGGTGVINRTVFAELKTLANVKTVRLAGKNRYETAVAISKYGWPSTGGVTSVYVATGSNFPDALAGAAEAAAKGVPILLTATNDLPTEVANEIDRLGVNTIYVLGGTGVVSTGVERDLKTHWVR